MDERLRQAINDYIQSCLGRGLENTHAYICMGYDLRAIAEHRYKSVSDLGSWHFSFMINGE